METEQQYDSTAQTLLHVKRVNELLMKACRILMRRAAVHDASKFHSPEKELFDLLTPKLAACEYGSEEYETFLTALKPALDHHYANNPHHPEHYANGVNGMNLFDLMEMFFDWKAASERQNNGNLCKSIDDNKKKFKLSGQLISVFKNTIKYMGW